MYFSHLQKKGSFMAAAMAIVGMLSLPLTAAPTDKQQARLFDTNQLIGHIVTNDKQQTLGIVSEVVIQQDKNKIAYVVLARGGFAGLGQDQHAMPLSAFTFTDDGRVTLKLTQSQLNDRKGFDDQQWPVSANRQGFDKKKMHDDAKMDKHADKAANADEHDHISDKMLKRYVIDPNELWARRVTQLNGLNVVDKHATRLGSLENFVFDIHSGYLKYAIVGYDGILGVGTKYSALPVRTLRIQANPRCVLFSGDQSKITGTMIDRGDVANFINDEAQQDRIDSQFGELDWLSALLDGNHPMASVVGDNRAWAPGSEYNQLYDQNTEMSVVGTIESLGVFYPIGQAEGADTGMRLRVRVNDNQVLTVHTGPLSSLRERHIDLRPTMPITVYGSKVNFENHQIIMARAIEIDGTTYHLREKNGKPMWVLDDMITLAQ